MNDANVTSLTANYSDDARKFNGTDNFTLLSRIIFSINDLTY